MTSFSICRIFSILDLNAGQFSTFFVAIGKDSVRDENLTCIPLLQCDPDVHELRKYVVRNFSSGHVV